MEKKSSNLSSKTFSLHKNFTFSGLVSNQNQIISKRCLNERRKKVNEKSTKNVTLDVLQENPDIADSNMKYRVFNIDDKLEFKNLNDILNYLNGHDNPASNTTADSQKNGVTDSSLTNNEKETSFVVLPRFRPNRFTEDINKRLSLPPDLNVPSSLLENRLDASLPSGPLSRSCRRQSLSEIGFGRIESYIKYELIGSGSYAMVYRGRSRLTGTRVALKEMRFQRDEGIPCTALREISLLKDLKHINIVTLHDIIYTETSLTMVMEYLEWDLGHFNGELDSYNVKIFLFQLLRGLAYCHKRKILHRDLKPQNILINYKGELKLADFSLARAISIPTKTCSNEVVSLWYRPPDVLLGIKDYSSDIDMWGVGCLLFEMFTRIPLFSGMDVEDQLYQILYVFGTPPKHWLNDLNTRVIYDGDITCLQDKLKADAFNFMMKFLEYERKKRISAFDAMRDEYFREFGPEVLNLRDDESIFKIKHIKFTQDFRAIGTRYMNKTQFLRKKKVKQ